VDSIDELLPRGPVAPRTPAQRRRLLRLKDRGAVIRLFPGIYCHPALTDDVETRIRGAALWSGDGVLTGAAAARVTFWPELPVPRVALSGRSKRRVPPGIDLSREALPPELIMEHRGLRVTVPALTALDLGPAGIDQVLLRRAATLDQLHAAIAATPNRYGNADRRRILHDSRDEPWSEAERRLHHALRSAKITGWRTNVEVWCQQRRYFLDLAFVGRRVAIEVDGYEVHSRRTQFERDRRKWSDLVAAGWLVLQFTWHQVTAEQDWVIATIRATLRLRSC
jgi:very-short-patch-repair endonuclease